MAKNTKTSQSKNNTSTNHQNGTTSTGGGKTSGSSGTVSAATTGGIPNGTVNTFPALPWTEIAPEMIAYGPGDVMLTIDHTINSKAMIQKMKDANLFDYDRVVFIIHGFWGNSRSKWIHDLKDKFLAESDQTFVIIGWGKGAELPAYKYAQAVSNAEPVGKWLGNNILEMKRKIGNKIKIWGIGEGIGAHIMGHAGRLSHAFWRITGKSLKETKLIN